MDYNREIIGACHSIVKEAEAILDYTHRLMETQSDAMRRVYADNRMDELPHIQNLVVAITAMLNGEEPAIAAQMDGNDKHVKGGDTDG